MDVMKEQGAGNEENNAQPYENAKSTSLSGGPSKVVVGGGQKCERRALAEIGNLAGAMNTRCNVSKDGFLKPAVPGCSRNSATVIQEPEGDHHPMSRKSGTNIGNKTFAAKLSLVAPLPAGKVVKLDAKVQEEVTIWGTKQRRTSTCNKVREGPVITSPTHGEPTVLDVQRSSRASSSEPDYSQLVELPLNLNQSPQSGSRTDSTSQAAYDAVSQEIEEDLFNIDYPDINNELAVTDYVEDIHNFYRRSELNSCVPYDYMTKQADVNYKMRAILMDWLIEVHLKFELMPETLFLTINLIDRYLCQQQVPRRLLQLVGVTAMLVAAKYEEIWAPEVDDFVYISDGAYTKQQLLAMERTILNTLQFNLTVPTPYVFMVRFLKAAHADEKMEMVAWYILELCLQEYNMLKFSPSLLAAAAIYSSNLILRTSPWWSASLQYHTRYCESQLRECASLMLGLHAKAGDNSLGVVYKKYSLSKFLSVAKLASATLHQPIFDRSDSSLNQS